MSDGAGGRRTGEDPSPEVIRVDLALRPGRREPDFPSLMRRRGALGETLVPDEVGLSPFLVFRRSGSFRLDLRPPADHRFRTADDGTPWVRWCLLGGEWSAQPPVQANAALDGDVLRLGWTVPEPHLEEAWICQVALIERTTGGETRAVLGLALRRPAGEGG